METLEYVKMIEDEIKNLKLRMEELKMIARPKYEKLWVKSKLNKAVSELADASMIICGLYPDNDTMW